MTDCCPSYATTIPVKKPAIPAMNSFVELMHYLRRLIEEQKTVPSYQDLFKRLQELGVAHPEREVRFGMGDSYLDDSDTNSPSPNWNEIYEDVAEADVAAVEQAHWYCAVRARGEFPRGWHIEDWSEWPPTPIRTPQELAAYLRERIQYFAEFPSQSSYWQESGASLLQNARNAASLHWYLTGFADGEPGESVPKLIRQLDQMVRILESHVPDDCGSDEPTARIVEDLQKIKNTTVVRVDNFKDKKKKMRKQIRPRNPQVDKCIKYLNRRVKSSQPKRSKIRDFCSEEGIQDKKDYENISRQVRRFSDLLKPHG